jgi:uncharacterized membrane protein
MENFSKYVQLSSQIIEVLGILVIGVGIVLSFFRFVLNKENYSQKYEVLRKELGKTILLGLEVLVAADIISTVVAETKIEQMVSLAIVVLIRTFLSFSIETEIEGKFPWKKDKN